MILSLSKNIKTATLYKSITVLLF